MQSQHGPAYVLKSIASVSYFNVTICASIVVDMLQCLFPLQ